MLLPAWQALNWFKVFAKVGHRVRPSASALDPERRLEDQDVESLTATWPDVTQPSQSSCRAQPRGTCQNTVHPYHMSLELTRLSEEQAALQLRMEAMEQALRDLWHVVRMGGARPQDLPPPLVDLRSTRPWTATNSLAVTSSSIPTLNQADPIELAVESI